MAMDYAAICQKSKTLYALLESLTTQINACKDFDCEMNVTGLVIQKDEVKDLIILNLEKLEQHWEMEAKVWLDEKPETRRFTPSDIEEKIITQYRDNPDLAFRHIAADINTTTTKISSVITKLLNKQYIGY